MNFTKLFSCHVISSLFFFFFFFFAIFTLFNLSSSLTIVFLVQFFIFSNHGFLNFTFDFLYKFLNFLLYIFINSMVSLFWTFHLLPPFQPFIFINSTVFTFLNLSFASTLTLPTWFSYKFLLLHFHLSPPFFPSCSEKGQ